MENENKKAAPSGTGKSYTPVSGRFGNTSHQVRGTLLRLHTKDSDGDLPEAPSGWFTTARADDRWSGAVIECADAKVKLHGGVNRSLIRRDVGTAKLVGDDGDVRYASFMRIRKGVIALLILAALIAAFLIASLAYRVPPQDMAIILADSVGITNNNKDTKANIEGTTSFQSPLSSDTHWKANSTSQHFVMANPTGNTVALAPHIYVDFNTDGNFSEDECVYNAIQYDSAGKSVSYGVFIDVGRQIEDIEITRTIDAGSYRAKVVYTAVDKETRTLCNGNEFVFDLSVE